MVLETGRSAPKPSTEPIPRDRKFGAAFMINYHLYRNYFPP